MKWEINGIYTEHQHTIWWCWCSCWWWWWWWCFECIYVLSMNFLNEHDFNNSFTSPRKMYLPAFLLFSIFFFRFSLSLSVWFHFISCCFPFHMYALLYTIQTMVKTTCRLNVHVCCIFTTTLYYTFTSINRMNVCVSFVLLVL